VWTCGGVVNNQIKKGSLQSLSVKSFKIGEYLAVTSKNVVVSCIVYFVRLAITPLKTKKVKKNINRLRFDKNYGHEFVASLFRQYV